MKTSPVHPGAATLLVAAAAILLPAAACRGREVPREGGMAKDDGSTATVKKVIDSPVAGSWYSADPEVLRRELQGYLDQADVREAAARAERVAAVISPHAGYRYSGATAAHGYRLLQGRKVRRVIVMGPSHRLPFGGLALPDATHWRTPLGEIPLDTEAVRRLAGSPAFQVLPGAFAREHSVDIQLPFLQVVAPGAVLVPIVVGHVAPEQVGEAGRRIRELMDEDTVVVASSDFTHYGPNYDYAPFRGPGVEARLKELADDAIAAITRKDLNAFRAHLARTGDTICGAAPIQVLMAATPGRAEPMLLKYDTSGRVTGDYENSVSYVSMGFVLPPNRGPFQGVKFLEKSDEDFLLKLARDTLRSHLAGKDPVRPAAPAAVQAKYGVFVTLKEHGDLRGCIGSIVGTEPLYEGVIRNTVNAAAHDPRFHPVSADEEPRIEIEISVLSPLREVQGLDDIVIGRDGILLSRGGSRAVFLPQVAPEQGWGIEETLTHLALKAGLPGNAWRSGATFETFQAQVFHEKE